MGRFTIDEVNYLAGRLKELNFNSNVESQGRNKGYIIRFLKESAIRFFQWIGNCPVVGCEHKWDMFIRKIATKESITKAMNELRVILCKDKIEREDFDSYDCPSSSTAIRIFGSWRAAVENRDVVPLTKRELVSESSLIYEWDWEKNIGDPNKLTCGSNKEAYWICARNPKHRWKSAICARVDSGGCKYCCGLEVLPEESFGALCSQKLKDEWFDERDMFKVTTGSNVIITWKCSKNPKHIWDASAKSRMRGNGCIYCRGLKVLPEESFGALHPEFLDEWDDPRDPFTFSRRSAIDVMWSCRKNPNHKWEDSPNRRVSGRNCPYCHGSRVLREESFGALCNNKLMMEWDDELDPFTFTLHSKQMINWKCVNPKHGCWPATIKSRSYGSGCSYCSGRKVLPEESFGALCSDRLMMEWNDEKSPYDYSQKSHEIVNWKCSINPKHLWPARLADRTCGTKCPYCFGNLYLREESFGALHPEVAEEWDDERDPFEFPPYSNEFVMWKCRKNPDHKWEDCIQTRTCGGRCPHCPAVWGTSQGEKDWLDSLGIPGLIRNKMLVVGGRAYRPDGFDPITNTVYKYDGDFWHGNPRFYDQDKMHPTVGKTFGELYESTLLKRRTYEEAGYKVVSIWESDFKKGKKWDL
jgi:hypothetical protein